MLYDLCRAWDNNGRGNGLPIETFNLLAIKAIASGLRPANDLLPAFDADVGGDPRYLDNR